MKCFIIISVSLIQTCRFIPDDVTFDDRTATNSCTDADVTKDYHPSE